jgi:hypothetical protein
MSELSPPTAKYLICLPRYALVRASSALECSDVLRK